MTDTEPNHLGETLAIVSERVDKHRGERIGEQNTKATLIVPVLRALGWNVEDLDEVHLEYRHSSSDRPVDYALMLQREPVLFIEAKGLDEDLNERRWASQVVSYATVAGVEWVVLTNGDEYRIYNAHAPVDLDGKLFRTVRVSDGVEETADALRLLTKDELRSKSLDALWRGAFSPSSRVGRPCARSAAARDARAAAAEDGRTHHGRIRDAGAALGALNCGLTFGRISTASVSGAVGLRWLAGGVARA